MSNDDSHSQPQVEQFLDDYRVGLLITVVAISCLLGCIQVYGFCLFKKNERLLIIQKRYPQLVMMESVVSCIGLFISKPLEFNSGIGAVSFSSSALDRFIRYFGIVILLYSTFFIVTIETLRLWLISYDLHYLSSSKNQQWKSQIDASCGDKDWYLRNRTKWGSKQYVGKYAVIYFLFTSNVLAILKIVILDSNPDYMWVYDNTNNLLSFPAVLAVFYVYFKTPKSLQDEFLFQYEFKRTMIIWGMGAIFILISHSVDLLEYHRLSATLTTSTLICSLYAPSLLVCLSPLLNSVSIQPMSDYVLFFKSTVWIPHQIRKMNVWNGKDKMMRLKQSKIAKKQRGKHPVDYLMKLRETLNDEHKFQMFIAWMYREFSSESILSFVEFIQFKQWLKQEIRKSGDSVGSLTEDEFDYKLYRKIPKSSIIYGQTAQTQRLNEEEDVMDVSIPKQVTNDPMFSETASLSQNRSDGASHIILEMPAVPIGQLRMMNPLNTRVRQIVHLLFKKYIKQRAEYEINISGKLRDKYHQLDKSKYAGVNLPQFTELFDEAISEMLMYIRQSFFRFYISDH